MKEHPIIFSSEMVRAILDGRKTQTRRAIKPQPTGSSTWLPYDEPSQAFYPNSLCGSPPLLKCPYGQPGDVLWVRETWRHRGYNFMNGQEPITLTLHMYLHDWFYIEYRANGVIAPVSLAVRDCIAYTKKYSGDKWRPSIFMPRWASRITLEITRVRVGRVQSISETDAIDEGVMRGEGRFSFIPGFVELWDSINAKRGHGWNVNPWVWVIEFRRIEQPCHPA